MNCIYKICTWFGILAMILAMGTDLPAKGFSKGEAKMKSSEEIAKSLLSISEDRYFNDTESLFEDMESKLTDIEFIGVAINAPQHVPVRQQEALPVIMAIQQRGLRAWEYPEDYNCVLAATDLTTHAVYFGQVFRDLKAETFASPPGLQQPPKPEGSSAVALISGLSRIDARQVLSLPWRAGKYRMSVVMFDWVSNTIEVTLTGDAAAQTATPAASPSPAAPEAPHRMPSFLADAANLTATGEKPPFARMTLQPNPAPEIKLTVRGAFTMLAAPFHLPSAPYELLEIDGQKHKVGAVVPATLAIVGKDWPTPLRYDWALPVYTESAIKPGDQIHGWFAIDPLAGSPITLAPGDYVAYLFIEGHAFGPASFKIQ